MSDVPPFDLNKPRIPIDCLMTVLERATGRQEVIYLGGNCKTETVGVPHSVWMEVCASHTVVHAACRNTI